MNSIGAVPGTSPQGPQGQSDIQQGESVTDNSDASQLLAQQFQSFLVGQMEQMIFQNAQDQDDDDDDDS